MPPRLSDLRRM